MACSGYSKIWDLPRGELIALDGARGTTLRVTRGMLWVTLEDDTRDVVLTPGDVFTIDRGGLTLVEAQTATTVCVMAHQVEMVRVRQGRASWRQRFSAWVEAVATATLHRAWAPYV